MAPLIEIQKDAFWSKVDISTDKVGCWNWLGAKKPSGYGNVRINKTYQLAHRVAFEIHNELQIPAGMVICHTCDNPSCCNPNHLMLGTKKANSFDMIQKRRDGFKKNKATGVRNANAKLNDHKVSEIKQQYLQGGKTQKQLAELYGVTTTCIGSIVRNETWRHVGG